MEIAEHLMEILKYTLPALMVFLTVYFMLRHRFEKQQAQLEQDLKTQAAKATLNIKLHAYERIVLFLERISPDNLVMRIHKHGMSSKLLHKELLRSIREEYEHNLAQQIYISPEAWSIAKQAKEETVNLINIAAEKAGDEATGVDLSTKIFSLSVGLNQQPAAVAIAFLKNEVQLKF